MNTNSIAVSRFAERIGASIRVARREQGWTMADLSGRLSMSRMTLTKVETGDPTVSFGAVLSAAIATRVDVAEVINLRPDQIIDRDREITRLAAQLPQRVRSASVSDDF